MMNRNTLSRLGRLERSATDQRRSVKVAYDHDEAVRLQTADPTAVVIITGVPRSPLDSGRVAL